MVKSTVSWVRIATGCAVEKTPSVFITWA
ncbi:uncharacterized protein METZ01_LOCUS323523 [marine metagenome]|uniref:Uncharacterized protein n=1 Tax=marine metagenome TaxID=408172 RepID=A0A382PBA6_9ZZZZ